MRWISVKDRLPGNATCYLKYTYKNRTGYALGYLDGGEWSMEWSSDYSMSGYISHWLEED